MTTKATHERADHDHEMASYDRSEADKDRCKARTNNCTAKHLTWSTGLAVAGAIIIYGLYVNFGRPMTDSLAQVRETAARIEGKLDCMKPCATEHGKAAAPSWGNFATGIGNDESNRPSAFAAVHTPCN
jgi:hypothetical protein